MTSSPIPSNKIIKIKIYSKQKKTCVDGGKKKEGKGETYVVDTGIQEHVFPYAPI